LGDRLRPWRNVDELCAQVAQVKPLTLATATDGNHGRAVARMGRLLDLPTRVYLPRTAGPVRIQALKDEGAEVIAVDGIYDEALARCVDELRPGDVFASDADHRGEEGFARTVLAGYGTLLQEVAEQLDDPPEGLMVQMGVGSLASSMTANLARLGWPAIGRWGTSWPAARCWSSTPRAPPTSTPSVGEGLAPRARQASPLRGGSSRRPANLAGPIAGRVRLSFVVELDLVAVHDAARVPAGGHAEDVRGVGADEANPALGELLQLADADPLRVQAPALGHRPARPVVPDHAVRTHHAVAGNQDRHRVGGERGAHRPHRLRVPDLLRDPAVGADFAARDLAGLLEDQALERRHALHVEAAEHRRRRPRLRAHQRAPV